MLTAPATDYYRAKLTSGECMAPHCETSWRESWICPVCGFTINLCSQHLGTQMHLVAFHQSTHITIIRGP